MGFDQPAPSERFEGPLFHKSDFGDGFPHLCLMTGEQWSVVSGQPPVKNIS